MKILILAPFVEVGTIYGMVAGLEANGHTWDKIETRPPAACRQAVFSTQVLQKFEAGGFDTILMCKGSPIPIDSFKKITAGADTTYWCPDSISGNGCGPAARPDEVGARGLLCERIICTGSEGARWYRRNGFKGRIAQIYQGCRHSIWRPRNFDRTWGNKYQISFIGAANYKGDGGRRAKLKALANAGFKLYKPNRIYHQEASSVYYNSAICLNMVCGTPGEGVTPAGITSNRLVRVLTSGGFSLTERNTDIAHTFEEGNQLATFDFGSAPHLLERARYYLDRPKERYEIARRGWEWSLNWGWDQQMEKMVRFIDGDDVLADGAAKDYVGTLKTDS